MIIPVLLIRTKYLRASGGYCGSTVSCWCQTWNGHASPANSPCFIMLSETLPLWKQIHFFLSFLHTKICTKTLPRTLSILRGHQANLWAWALEFGRCRHMMLMALLAVHEINHVCMSFAEPSLWWTVSQYKTEEGQILQLLWMPDISSSGNIQGYFWFKIKESLDKLLTNWILLILCILENCTIETIFCTQGCQWIFTHCS